ncbi:hypothetical protein CAEBREN_30260 [Caenorhabditis brenneri]|uniref:RNA-directed DNA polymerase n=1 Tax=Caenorhabditis brenneri TaxID=135651 RepID=G0NAF6_CAEBE|nr:hypothetical protein CAEBREN_30260 [Caenorhabditis brenneri]
MTNAEAMNQVLQNILSQLAESNAITQSLIAENRELRERQSLPANSSSDPEQRMAAGGHRTGSNARLIGDLSRRLPKYAFNVSEPDSFKKWIGRYKLVFLEDGAPLSERERTRLLIACLEESTFQRFLDSQRDVEDVYDVKFEDTVDALMKVFGNQRSLMMRRQACLQISRSSGLFQDPLEYTNKIGEAVTDAKLASMSGDDWSVFIFLRGLDTSTDSAAKLYLMQFVESIEKKGETVTLSQVHDEWIRFIQMRQQTKVVAANSAKTSQAVQVQKVSAKVNNSTPKKAPKDSPKKSASKTENSGKQPVTCTYCNKVGHTAEACYKRKREQKTEKSGSSGEQKTHCIHVDGILDNTNSKRSLAVSVNNTQLSFDLDTGSMITIINTDSWQLIGKPKLETVSHRISCANGSPMKVLGRTKVKFRLKNEIYEDYVYVRDRDTNLLGMSWINHSPAMTQVLDVMVNRVELPEEVASRLERTLMKEFPEVFSEGLGLCVKEQAQFRVDPATPPVFKRARPVPYGSLEAVEAELHRLQSMGVIEPVSHSKWASPIVVIKKKDTGKIRACGDFKVSGLNNALLDEFHPLPTSEDIFASLKGSVFSQIDLKDAYLQVELDDESQKLVVINTHKGLFKYKRMVSPSKCSFAKPQISYLGFVVDKDGRHPDPTKTEAIRNMKAPTDQKQLASFLGGICFYSRFIPELSALRGPLDKLMKKDAKWVWTDVEQKAFKDLTDAVAHATLLSHFHADWPMVVSADASAYGIGGVLTHIDPQGVETPVAHFARALTDTEQRYSQIEKEALALIYTVKKCHKFIFGRRFTLHTDHRPLLAIFGSHKDLPVHAQNRLVRWAMTLRSYDFEISYVNTTKFAKADWLSRVIQEYPRNNDDVVIAEVDSDDFEDLNVDQLAPVLEHDVRVETSNDSELTEVVSLVIADSWKAKPKSEIEKAWHHLKDRLKVIHGCLLLDDRVVVPRVLQAKVLKQLHEGHPGVVKMKHKARSFVYWKGLDSQIEKLVQRCDNCQTQAKMPRVTPLNPWPVPEAPWTRIHVDYAGPVDGMWFLVVVDAKSKYAEVKLTRSISAVATVDLMEEIFSTHGYLIVSDNGTQLTSQLFKNMCESYGIRHQTTAVYYPRSNGAAERFVDTLKRGIGKIKGASSVNQQILNKFLINYRNTPHAALNGATPAEVHFNRKLRVKMSLLLPGKNAESAALTPYQSTMKQSYDKRNAARAKNFQVGQTVYARVQHGNKWSWEYGEIRRRIGSVLYEVQVGSRIQRCHVNQLRIRFGDQSPEERFADSIFPLFFHSPALSTQNASGDRGEANPVEFPDSQSFEYPDDFDEFRSPRHHDSVLTPGGRSADESELHVNTPRSEQARENVSGRQTSTPARPEESPGHDNYTNSTAPRVEPPRTPSPTQSHALRRSQRQRQAPIRYDPCSEFPSSSATSALRGSFHTQDQSSTRNRGRHNASNRRGAANYLRGEGVGDLRGRPRWH